MNAEGTENEDIYDSLDADMYADEEDEQFTVIVQSDSTAVVDGDAATSDGMDQDSTEINFS